MLRNYTRFTISDEEVLGNEEISSIVNNSAYWNISFTGSYFISLGSDVRLLLAVYIFRLLTSAVRSI